MSSAQAPDSIAEILFYLQNRKRLRSFPVLLFHQKVRAAELHKKAACILNQCRRLSHSIKSLCLDLVPDALAVQRGSIHIKILADGLGDGAKAQTGAKVNARLHALAADQVRHILAGVVGGLGIGRVAAMVSGDMRRSPSRIPGMKSATNLSNSVAAAA